MNLMESLQKIECDILELNAGPKADQLATEIDASMEKIEPNIRAKAGCADLKTFANDHISGTSIE